MDWRQESTRLFVETELTLQVIAKHVCRRFGDVRKHLKNQFGLAAFEERKRACYARSKTGDLNPMSGKTHEQHHNWIGGVVADGRGYLLETKPDWYTGRKGSKYIFQHTRVLCQALGLTQLPEGFVIHHLDGDRTNNTLANLLLMTMGAHAHLHHGQRNDQSASS